MKQKNVLTRRFIMFLTLVFLMFNGSAFASAAAPESSQSKPDLLIRKIMGLAYESQQSINSGPFSVGDSLKKVKKAWGPPEDLSTVAANYWSRNVRFLYDDSTGRQTITAIEDFDPQLQTIHLSDLKGLIGEPVSEVEQEGNYYVTYTGYAKYKVVFVFDSAWINPDPILTMYTVEVADQ
ncbi:DUF4309 domain-containing protein [Fictibacillus terranigra]|uniref:DUF4309 domain-containing protein n=1 Tax=Fictibacillus terranigra TaxID=3058424 RepID=A0ABT8EDR9_9BACL|nr:DUF4309 domain-containing protein [Fictibacillus sp. CENA-BCM004]MDN4076081.1 DUF4309 domain-containing protein [Fictibacillus sp. CENA-BCM004]